MADRNPHLTQEQLTAFHHNQLGPEEYIYVLEHISNCTHCAALFASSFQQEQLLSAPPGLKASILAKAEQKSIPKLFLPWKSTQRRQLFFYSLKVCAAMCGALLIMISSMQLNFNGSEYHYKSSAAHENHMEFFDNLTTSIKDFSDGISANMNSLVTVYDKKDKSNTNTEVNQ